MKYIIIGLGNFGSSLAMKLTELGNEVIGVDKNMEVVDSLKESISHTICLNCTDTRAVSVLPLKDTDIVIVAIGENEGENIMTTALMKQMKAKRLISRAVSPLHETILQTMEVNDIIHAEEETAERWAKKLNFAGVIDSFELAGQYTIAEIVVHQQYAGKSLAQIEFPKKHNILVLSVIKTVTEKNLIGISRKVKKVQGLASAETILAENDTLVIYGKMNDISKMLEED